MSNPTSKNSTEFPVEGDIIEVPLPGGFYAYARVLKNPLMGFYALRSSTPASREEILNAPILFKVWVMNSALTSGRWKIVGHAALEEEHKVSPCFFKQDAISKKLSLYREGIEQPATFDECKDLERAAVWSAEHVESRLDDELSGRANKWKESLRPKIKK